MSTTSVPLLLCLLCLLPSMMVLVEGATVTMNWPSPTNIGPDLAPGDTLHFVWTDAKSHNVLQVYNWTGNLPPLNPFQNAHFTNQIRSGDPVVGGSFDWHVGTVLTGYRPGSYFFVDEGNPSGGIVSVGITYPERSNLFPPLACSNLANASYYGGRYAAYARPNCTFYQVNNYQTAAHFDWVYPTFAMLQGDLVIFQWSNEHNIVQVHDVRADTLIPGGITSGPKKNCVPGPNWTCINQQQNLGEYVFDSTNWRPGMIHISDDCAYRCTGHTTGMNMEFFIQRPPNQRPPKPVLGSCCQFDSTKGTDCRVIEIYADGEGQQFNYNIPAGKNDLVRFRWAGSMKVYQSVNNNGPSSTPLTGGYGMSSAVECIPGPNWSCLGGNTDQAQWIFDVGAALSKGLYTQDRYSNKWFDFYGVGENTDGYTSQNSGTIIYLDNGVTYNSNRTAVACPASSTSSSSTTASATITTSTSTSTGSTTKATTASTAATSASSTSSTTTKVSTTSTSSSSTTKASTTKVSPSAANSVTSLFHFSAYVYLFLVILFVL